MRVSSKKSSKLAETWLATGTGSTGKWNCVLNYHRISNFNIAWNNKAFLKICKNDNNWGVLLNLIIMINETRCKSCCSNACTNEKAQWE